MSSNLSIAHAALLFAEKAFAKFPVIITCISFDRPFKAVTLNLHR